MIFSKHEKQAFVKQYGNCDWALLIEVIGFWCQLLMWCIFKGKVYIDKWYNALESDEEHKILLSDNR